MNFNIVLILSAATAIANAAPTLQGFGEVQRNIDTRSVQAQFFFNQGLRLAYAFDEKEAVRSFKAALEADPACAMCAWGAAWQLGPNYNHERGPDHSEARRYAALAQKLLPASATPLERDLIAAMVTRYGSADTPAAAAAAPPADVCGAAAGNKSHPFDVAYAQQMHMLSDAYPKDPDLQALFVEAELIVSPRAGYDVASLQTLPRTRVLIARLEGALREHPKHTGLIHYYTHAADTPDDAIRAARVSEALPRLAPNSPHLLHMPSHLYIRLGRYAEAVRSNQAALASQVRMTQSLERQGFKLLTDWNAHNRRFLWISAQVQGDSRTAMAQARKLADSAGAKTDDWSQYLRAMPLLTMVHFEQWADILKATSPATPTATLAPNVVAHARGAALLRTGVPADAYVAALEKDRAQAKSKSGASFAGQLLAPLTAEQAFSRGDAKTAKTILTLAAADEPEFITPERAVWAASAQRSLGYGLLRTKDFSGAETAFRADLKQLPANVWSLRGLHRALLGQGRKADAARVLTEWRRSGASADLALRP
jgi:tetratricopeptide (TPR) repeat protein